MLPSGSDPAPVVAASVSTYRNAAGPSLDVPEPAKSAHLSLDGRRVFFEIHGSDSNPTVVLIHGARAHRGWWHAVLAAGLADSLRVIVFDLAGHGLSDHLPEYSPRAWADQVAGVVRVLAGGRAVVVGHSLGGLVSYATAAHHPDTVSRLVTFDSKVRVPTPDGGAKAHGVPAKPLRPYPTREDILDAFRLMPSQPWVNTAAVRHVAEMGIVEHDGAWRWRFDPAIAQRFTDRAVAGHLHDLQCPVEFLYGSESSLVSAQTVRAVDHLVGGLARSEVIPGGHHHVVLDQPAAVRDAILAATARADSGP